jgi:hypothetical protein
MPSTLLHQSRGIASAQDRRRQHSAQPSCPFHVSLPILEPTRLSGHSPQGRCCRNETQIHTVLLTSSSGSSACDSTLARESIVELPLLLMYGRRVGYFTIIVQEGDQRIQTDGSNPTAIMPLQKKRNKNRYNAIVLPRCSRHMLVMAEDKKTNYTISTTTATHPSYPSSSCRPPSWRPPQTGSSATPPPRAASRARSQTCAGRTCGGPGSRCPESSATHPRHVRS